MPACAAARYRPVTVSSRCNAPDGILSTVQTGRTPSQPTLRALLPRPTVRWRLTLLYSLLFLICGAALLAITYWLFANFAISPPKEPFNPVMVHLQAAMTTRALQRAAPPAALLRDRAGDHDDRLSRARMAGGRAGAGAAADDHRHRGPDLRHESPRTPRDVRPARRAAPACRHDRPAAGPLGGCL